MQFVHDEKQTPRRYYLRPAYFNFITQLCFTLLQMIGGFWWFFVCFVLLLAEKLIPSSLCSQFKHLLNHGIQIQNFNLQVLYLVILKHACKN